MSIDIDWPTITSGPDGAILAEKIRSFVHDKFQQVTLPRFIRAVEVHSFDFGTVCPQLEIKDIGEPLPDFYEDDGDGDRGSSDGSGSGSGDGIRSEDGVTKDGSGGGRDYYSMTEGDSRTNTTTDEPSFSRHFPPSSIGNFALPGLRTPFNFPEHFGGQVSRSGTPGLGVPGGTSNLSYFHLPLGGLSGTQTPLAAVASGTNLPPNTWSDITQARRQPHTPPVNPRGMADDPQTSPNRPSTADSLLPPSSIGSDLATNRPNDHPGPTMPESQDPQEPSPPRIQPSPNDLQVITHVKYGGDIRLSLTAEILLDYPMPSFVGIPLKLCITGLTFDGVAVLASVRRHLHFCFLAPEDAEMVLGDAGGLGAEEGEDGEGGRSEEEKGKIRPKTGAKKDKMSGLLEEIKVESEIGNKDGGKQVLKNVGKVERFVLEQVRRIFEEEFVFPSFWTFLV